MPEVVPIKNLANATTLYDNNGECVGRYVPETGRGVIGDCFVVKERVTELAWDEDTCSWFCKSCECDFDGLFDNEDYKPYIRYCCECGARVVF